jgi:hypothetical protein
MKKSGKIVVIVIFVSFLFRATGNTADFFDVNNDGKTGLHESIYALQIAAGIIHTASDHYIFTGSGVGCNSGSFYDYELDFQTQGNFIFGKIKMGKQGKPIETFQLQNGVLQNNTLNFRVIDAEKSIYQFAMFWTDNALNGGITKLSSNSNGFIVTEFINVDLKFVVNPTS